MRTYLFAFFLLLPLSQCLAQLGGRHTFPFLNTPSHARSLALGGINVSSQDRDVNMFANNPALLTQEVSGLFALNYQSLQAGIHQTQLAWSGSLPRLGQIGVAFQYLDYGKFEGYDAAGNPTNEFTANDFCLGITKAYQTDNYHLGATLKWAGSRIDRFSAGGFFLDLGGSFTHPEKDLIVGMVIKNLGFLYQHYSPTSQYTPPFDVQVGTSYKPERMPLRLSLTMHNFRNRIAYNDPQRNTQLGASGQPVPIELSDANKVFRRIVVGTELIINPNFQLRAGYNFLRRQELLLAARPALVGFSFGMMVRVRSFEFAYSRSLVHIAGGHNQISLILDAKKVFASSKTHSNLSDTL
jgi:hypothetical protein